MDPGNRFLCFIKVAHAVFASLLPKSQRLKDYNSTQILVGQNKLSRLLLAQHSCHSPHSHPYSPSSHVAFLLSYTAGQTRSPHLTMAGIHGPNASHRLVMA